MNKTMELINIISELKENQHSFDNFSTKLQEAFDIVDGARDDAQDLENTLEQMSSLLGAYERGVAV